jgi:hypothetical protein
MAYGESKSFQEQQQGAPLGDSGGANAPFPMQQAAGPNVFGATDLPSQPATEGIPIGEGGGPTRDIANNVDILLSAMYQVNPHPVIAQLLNSRST